MQWQSWSKVLLYTGVLLGMSVLTPVLSQNPPARTYQPGYWQPVARVNPRSPIRLVVINGTGLIVEYGLTEQRDVRSLRPGARTQIYNFPLPTFLAINPSTGTSSLKYDVAVNENIVTLTLQETDGASDRTFNIDKSGAIYIY